MHSRARDAGLALAVALVLTPPALYVLEYDHSLPERQWTPRVRKLARDGQVVTLATVRR